MRRSRRRRICKERRFNRRIKAAFLADLMAHYRASFPSLIPPANSTMTPGIFRKIIEDRLDEIAADRAQAFHYEVDSVCDPESKRIETVVSQRERISIRQVGGE